jgi:hypothetical protein
VHLPSPQGTSSTTTAFAAPAVDASHRTQQKNQKAPERNELETALGELIVPGPGLMAARTDCRRSFARAHGDHDVLAIGTEAVLPLNESGKAVGLEKDLPPGEKLGACFRPFLEALAASDLSPKII